MKNIKYYVSLLLLTLLMTFCSQKGIEKVSFLEGTWKVEGKETYESWEKDANTLVGASYKLREGKKYISETLEIKSMNGKMIYTAIVKNQNKGKGIPFTLQPVKDKLYSFENLSHDFPKKIQYKVLSKNEIQVNVLGKEDKGFSYKVIKQ
ncbi:MAG: hypothetical protein JXQ93_11650 [Flavobacteriaceae bacterium]